MRRFVCLSIAVVMLLLAFVGCVENDPAKSAATDGNWTTVDTNMQRPTGTGGEVNNTTGNNPTEPTKPIGPTDPVVVVPPTSPKNPVDTVIPFDPDRDIYLLCSDMNLTIYKPVSSMRSISLYIFSKGELDVNTISLELSAQSDYVISVGEIALDGIVNGSTAQRTQFSYELYQCYMGKDFAKLWELENAYWACYDAYFNKREITSEEFHAAEEAYVSYRDAERESYLQLTKADLPNFRVYYASASFIGENFVEEVITEGQLRIDDQIHNVTFGEIRLTKERPEYPAELDWYNGGGFAYDGILGSGNSPLPYNDGIHRIEVYFSFTTDHYMLLTDFKLDNPNHKLEAVWIEMVSPGGFSYSGLWDMSEPFELMPGDRVMIHIAYRDKTLHSLSYATKVWGYLIYEWDEGTSCKLSECDVRTAAASNFYEMYALIFEGLDLESYYRDYYYPKYESWRYDS